MQYFVESNQIYCVNINGNKKLLEILSIETIDNSPINYNLIKENNMNEIRLYNSKDIAIWKYFEKEKFYNFYNNILYKIFDIDEYKIKLCKNGYSGIQKGFHNNGILKYEFFHINGKKEGKYKSYYLYGNICLEIDFVDGKNHGTYKKYRDNKNNQVLVYYEYSNNKKNGIYRKYDDKNNIVREYNYIDDKLNGKSFNSKKNILIISEFIDDKLNGPYKKYKDNKLIIEVNHINGKKDGEYIKYNKFGKIIFHELYHDGKKLLSFI